MKKRPPGIMIFALVLARVLFGLVLAPSLTDCIPALVATVVIAYGLWQCTEWAWWGAMTLFVLALAESPLGAIVGLTGILYLLDRTVMPVYGPWQPAGEHGLQHR